MREKYIRYAIITFVAMGLLVQPGFTQGLLGKRYIGLEISQMTPGDDYIKDIDDSILGLGAGINIPVNPNVDAVVSLSYEKIEGEIEGLMLKEQQRLSLAASTTISPPIRR